MHNRSVLAFAAFALAACSSSLLASSQAYSAAPTDPTLVRITSELCKASKTMMWSASKAFLTPHRLPTLCAGARHNR